MQDSLKQIMEMNPRSYNWTEILTAFLVIITGFYVYFTFRMMKA